MCLKNKTTKAGCLGCSKVGAHGNTEKSAKKFNQKQRFIAKAFGHAVCDHVNHLNLIEVLILLVVTTILFR